MNDPAARDGDAIRPLLVTGGATDEELAALLAVLQVAGRRPRRDERAPAEWASPRRSVRVAHRHGPGGWRASGLPR